MRCFLRRHLLSPDHALPCGATSLHSEQGCFSPGLDDALGVSGLSSFRWFHSHYPGAPDHLCEGHRRCPGSEGSLPGPGLVALVPTVVPSPLSQSHLEPPREMVVP